MVLNFNMARCFALLALFGLVGATADVQAENWPRFRGPLGTGHSAEKGLPVSWDDSAIVWAVDLPVQGHSSPIVWQDRVFLTGWTKEGDVVNRHVVCLDRTGGKLVWQHKTASGTGEDLHKMNSWATPSCATDGECVVAFFGDGGLHAFSVDGDPLWSRDLGTFPGAWGVGASPIILGDLVIQNCDATGESYLLAVEKSTGKTVWKTPRQEKPRGGWSTPLLIEHEGKTELVLNGEFGVQAYDPNLGKELWFCKGFNGRGTPVPAWGNGMLYVVNGKAGDVYAIVPGGSGDVTESRMQWHTPRKGGRDLPSPILSDNVMLVISMSGIATGYDANDGTQKFKQRLGGNFSGSPVAADGHIYIAAENGEILVLKLGDSMSIVARNTSPLSSDEVVRSSLAVSDGQLLMRSDRRLYCIGKP